MRVNGRMTGLMDMDFINIRMGLSMKETGGMIYNTERE
jgi:hypothetical protein